MDADLVHLLVARCLIEADFLSDEAGAACGAALGAIGLERLALLRGFITKVKHNSLRSVLPCTFRLLAVLGEELVFFRDYAPVYLAVRQDGPLPVERQLELLERHIRKHFDDSRAPTGEAIIDMLTHEATVWRIRSRTMPSQGRAAKRGAVAWRGILEMRQYRADVLAACAALSDRTFDRDRNLIQRPHTLAYWRAGDAGGVDIFEIDDITRVLFSLVDGRRGLRQIAAALSTIDLGEFAWSDIRDFFAEAAQRGFVEPMSRAGRAHLQGTKVPACG